MIAKSQKLNISFHWLNSAQFFGAFNDNLFKLLVIFSLIAVQGVEKVAAISATAGALFVVPFLLFSPFAGYIADRFNKRPVIIILKVAEIGIMLLGLVSVYKGSIAGLYATLFLMATQSAFFGPAKNAMIPELVDNANLTRANGLVTMASYLAIILGTTAAAGLSDIFNGDLVKTGMICVVVAAVGALCSMLIRKTGETEKSQKQGVQGLRAYKEVFRDIAANAPLRNTLLGSMLFVFIGSFIQLSIIPYGMTVLHLSREQSSYLFLLAALGIGIGGFIAGQISRKNPEFALMPLGALGIAVSSLVLCRADLNPVIVSAVMAVMGFCGGLFIVPINTLIQMKSDRSRRGAVMAVMYVADFSAVLCASGMLGLLSRFSIPVNSYFLVCVVSGAILTVGSFIILYKYVLRFMAATVIRIVYRFKVRGLDSANRTSPALFLCNHLSWIDALFIAAALPRPVRFLMSRDYYDVPVVRFFMKLIDVIPVSHQDGPHALRQSLTAARAALDAGDDVCIFPEGGISRNGALGKIKNGYHSIVADSAYPVIPVFIDGAWGSSFSYYGGRPFSQPPSLQRRAIQVLFGAPCPSTIEPQEVRQKLMELSAESFTYKKSNRRSLASQFITSARRNWLGQAMNDTTGKQLSFGKTLIASLILADILKKQYSNARMIGVLLPASVGGALVNIACTLAGKIPVNINFTASKAVMQSIIKQCSLQTIITSRKFMAKLNRSDMPGSLVFVEDIMKTITPRQRVAAMLKALFVPRSILAQEKTFDPDSMATVLFSSGSTAEPKGIVLSHHNIISNIESLRDTITLHKSDGICAALPLFHSFGFTVTIWLPLLTGFKASYHPNPLDGEAIAKLVRENRSTLLMATPTFLKTYIRKAEKEDFASLRLVVVGAEKLRKSLSDSFFDKFGIQPLEGFGATELSPVASLNIPDVTFGRKTYVGNKPGSVGRPLYGIAAKIVDPDTGEPLSTGEQGLLLVKGPSVMSCYLNQLWLTQKTIQQGWYNTGDIAVIDEDGFLTLTDRLSRFSKIGGEMIPHGAIEDAFHKALGTDEQVVAVTAIPDETRGEKIVVLYTPGAGGEDNLRFIMEQADLPNLWKPGCDAYVPVDEIPILPTGKTDLKGIKTLATGLIDKNTYKIAA